MDWCEHTVAMGRVVCPKPRRAGPTFLSNRPSMVHLRLHMRDDAELKSGAELVGLILQKEDFGPEQYDTSPSPPPFFFGSPPCRTSNPLVHDSHFGVKMLTSMGNPPADSASASPRLVHHATEQVGKKQAPVRVEGFDC